MLPASTRLILILLLLSLPTLAACDRQSDQAGQMRGTELAIPLERPDLVFTDTQGNPYDFRRETAGKVTLLFFGYTHCPDICPMHMANIAAVMDDLPYHQAKNLEVLFVTVDPQRDTPERVAEWLANFDASFKGLFVKNQQILADLETSLNLPRAVTMPTDTGSYDVGHATQVMAFGPTGPAKYVYLFGVRQKDWAHDLPILLRDAGTSDSPARVEQSHKKHGEQKSAHTHPPAGPATIQPQGTSAMRIELALIPAPPANSPAALYLSIRNSGPDDALMALSTPMSGRAELHTVVPSEDDAQRMIMQQVVSVPVPTGELTRLRPGAHHGMLMEPTHQYAAGQTIPVVLEFRDAGPIPITARVVDYGDVEATLDMQATHEH